MRRRRAPRSHRRPRPWRRAAPGAGSSPAAGKRHRPAARRPAPRSAPASGAARRPPPTRAPRPGPAATRPRPPPAPPAPGSSPRAVECRSAVQSAHALDPRPGPVVQRVLVGHQATRCQDDPEVRTLVAVVAGLEDAQEERLLLRFHRTAVIVEAVEHDAVARHATRPVALALDEAPDRVAESP